MPSSQQAQLSTSSATALEAVESGLRRSIINHCLDQRTVLLTYFVSSEEQEYMRERVQNEELRSRCDLKLEELENIERTQRFDILFDAECEWETLTGRLGAESFSMVTRKVLEELEQRQFLNLAKQLTEEREYVHRCDIMLEGLLPGFIREQETLTKEAWETMSDSMIEECIVREALVREQFLEDAPMLSSFSLQREEIEGEETIHRTHFIETPFFNYIDITKKVRDEFAQFWYERLLQFHQFLAVDEEDAYKEVLLEEEFVNRELDLIPEVVGGLETMWRASSVEHPEVVERQNLEIDEALEKEAAVRVANIECKEEESRAIIRLLFEFSAHTWDVIFPDFVTSAVEIFDAAIHKKNVIAMGGQFTCEFMYAGYLREAANEWCGSVFKAARSALVDREDYLRVDLEDPYFDLEDFFALEAQELHTRHKKVMTNQIDQVYRIYQKSIIHEEYTARQYIVDVEWENGIIFMYASFHRLWLETVTMGVTRNALKREWERETLVMHEVWVRLGIASRAAFAIDSEVMGQVREFMPDFDEQAAPLPDDEEDDTTDNNNQDRSIIANGDGVEEGSATRKRKPKKPVEDVNALPAVFYIGEDPFGNDSSSNNDASLRKRKQQQQQSSITAPAPPTFSSTTPGIVIRYRTAPRKNSNENSNNNNEDLPNLDSSNRPPGRFARSKNLDSVFSSPSLSAAAGSVWISPDTFDVVSIRATLKVLGKLRNHAFALLTQFFQITHRKHLESKYEDWLEGYGDMGYWAHAIEVGLLDQLHNLDEDLIEQTDRTQDQALRRSSPKHIRAADDQLSEFVHDQDARLSQQRNRKKRTVIDALRESLRQPPRPSQRKLKPVAFRMDPDMMCPRPKSSFSEWSPSRMTPDEFAHYEHNLFLRSAGVEKKNAEATASTGPRSGALPTSRTGDPGWSIYQRASHPVHNHHHHHHSYSQHHSRRDETTPDGDGEDYYSGSSNNNNDQQQQHYDEGRNSPGNRPDATVKFNFRNRPVSAQTIPRLAPSRLSDREEDQLQHAASVPNARRHHEKQVRAIAKSSSSSSSKHRSRGALNIDPNVENRKLQFSDIFENENDIVNSPVAASRHHQQRAAASSPSRSLKSASSSSAADRNKNNSSSLSSHEQNTMSAYKKVLTRTEYSQRSMTESTSEFLHQSMRPISLMVRPTPPPTPIPGNVSSPRKPSASNKTSSNSVSRRTNTTGSLAASGKRW